MALLVIKHKEHSCLQPRVRRVSCTNNQEKSLQPERGSNPLCHLEHHVAHLRHKKSVPFNIRQYRRCWPAYTSGTIWVYARRTFSHIVTWYIFDVAAHVQVICDKHLTLRPMYMLYMVNVCQCDPCTCYTWYTSDVATHAYVIPGKSLSIRPMYMLYMVNFWRCDPCTC